MVIGRRWGGRTPVVKDSGDVVRLLQRNAPDARRTRAGGRGQWQVGRDRFAERPGYQAPLDPYRMSVLRTVLPQR